jgi:hypothetical protein
MSTKDINTLIKLARKLGESVCDAGTYEERKSKYHVMKWMYKGNAFTHKFPGTNNTSTLNHQYSQMRKNLRASGLGPSNKFTSGITSSEEHQKLLEDLWLHLGTDDEGGTPYGGDVDR